MTRRIKKSKIVAFAAALLSVAVFASACAVDDGYITPGAGIAPPEVTEDDATVEELETPEEEPGYDDEVIFEPEVEPEEEIILDDIPEFFSISGTVESIISASPEADEDDPWHGISVKIIDENGNEAVLNTTANTSFPFGNEIQEGDTVTAWYATNAPMIMIWPPQYTATVLAVNIPDGANIKVDRFGAMADTDQLLSADGMFAFSTDENTEIILADGTDFTDGDLQDRRIVVLYGMSTRSIPEQATATKLIVLFEDIMPLA
ncbi:MAG: hypothetical protein FWC13_01080 [Oscillospiraceae bacterium]|nr:hypothetical protein [Oscillospiraceae bacterium]